MKHLFTSCLLVLGLVPAALHAQTAPAMPAAAPANLSGQALRTWYLDNWYNGKRVELSYATARGKMYNYADNYNNLVTCVYSGYQETVPYSTTNTSTGVVNRINCEHTVPQSWFNEVVRMRSDMHHLFPTYDTWNNLRGSDPFAEIPDAQTQTWMRLLVSQATIPTANIAEWSEDTNTQFEPREDHKGNLARAVFYFYTMHAGQSALVATGHGDINSVANINTLYAWHLADPVDAREIERNRRVAVSQGNYNPYIEYPATVATAWGLAPAGPTFRFGSTTGTIAEGNSGTSTYTFTLNLSAAATTATTVQVNVDGTNSTATNGTDFTFASPATVTFPAGSISQPVTLTVNGDSQPEADETVVLTLTNPSTGNSIGSPGTHTLTITNDDGTPPSISFASATGSIAEGNSGTSTYTVNVTASGTLPTGAFTVPVSVDAANSTATAATDYVLNTTSLTFSATTLTQAVTVMVNGDATFEPNETVRLRLGTPSNATIIVGQPNTHTLTILNDDAAPAGAPCTKPYFSRYVEGLINNTKVLEIYNPTLSPMPLAGKSVALYANGATTPTNTQQLTGTIAPGDVYVIVNTGVVDAGVAAQADLQSNVAFFNGNDAVALFDGTDTLDVIGVIGQQPTEWTVPGGGSTLNNTLVRKPTTSQGGRWNGPNGSATWSGGGVDTFTGVGAYTSTACFVPTASRGAAVLRNALEIYPNPASETVQLRLPGAPAARPATIEVLDVLGRPVRQRAAQLGATDAVPVDLRGLPAGIYAIRVLCETVTYTGRVVVK
jgi:endonuclease I